MCCEDDWEIRQPQDFVRGVPDTQIAPWLRPEPTDSFVPVTTYQPMTVYPSVSNSSLQVHYIEGPARQSVISYVTAILNWVKKFPITAGAREVNGSSINNNSIG